MRCFNCGTQYNANACPRCGLKERENHILRSWYGAERRREQAGQPPRKLRLDPGPCCRCGQQYGGDICPRCGLSRKSGSILRLYAQRRKAGAQGRKKPFRGWIPLAAGALALTALIAAVLLLPRGGAPDSSPSPAPARSPIPSPQAGSLSEGLEALEALGGIAVDEDLLTAELTLPAALFAGVEALDEAVQSAEGQEGIISAVKNADGSLTYVMTKQKFGEYQAAARDNLLKSFEECKAQCSSILDMDVSEAADRITLYVDGEGWKNSMDSLSVVTFSITALMFQQITGRTPGCTIEVVDKASGAQIESQVY